MGIKVVVGMGIATGVLVPLADVERGINWNC
jgi:hypothetical protein